ncbi:MAG TPA: DUF4177 domain-containing protein [Paracoccaceae bacterium]|nr:DUF4177 domain-containing protein [Paracoccaceae bacterium]
MQRYEYKVVPAPRRGEKVKGAKTVEDRFAVALAHVMNDLGAEGWEYLRADTLPCEERVGLTGKATHFHHMLVFRRVLPAGATAPAPASAPVLTADAPAGHAPALPPATAAVPGPTPAVGPALGPLVAPQASTRPPAQG